MNSINNTFLVGHSIELRVPSDDDIERSDWHSWYNNMATTENNTHGVYPISVRQEAEVIRSIMDQTNTILCSIYNLKSGNLIGNAALQNIDLINRNCNIAITIGTDAPFTACAETYGLLATHAFMRLNLEGIHDATHEKLKTVVSILSVVGFKEEGVIERFFLRDDKWYSKILFGVLREDFIKLQTERSGNILFENRETLQRAIIDAVKESK
jgi:RimJ/RimL family protein N-acetyltransferase